MRRALEMQIATGGFFGAERMVCVTSAHLTGDPESMGNTGFASALYGKSIAGKVFVCPLAKRGFATSWALVDLKSRGLAPAGMIFGWANPVMVQGAVLAGVALMDRLSPDPMETIRTGDWVRVDLKAGVAGGLEGFIGWH